jgi:ribosomal protein S27AE
MDFQLHPHDDAHTYHFCPRCGGALERRLLKATEPERLVCTRCGFVFYIDPKIAVGTIIKTPADRLVLVKRAIDPGYGKWVVPGGYVDRGETPHTPRSGKHQNAGSTSGSTASSTSTLTPAARRSSSFTPRPPSGVRSARTRSASKRLSSTPSPFHGTI